MHRCAVASRSPLALRDTHKLYNILSEASVLKTNGITTQYTLFLDNDVEKVVDVSQGNLHMLDLEDKLEFFVPQMKKERKICYIIDLPQALNNFFEIPTSATEIIGNILNNPLSVLDTVLETAGIGMVPGIDPPLQDYQEDSEGSEVSDNGEMTASLRQNGPRQGHLVISGASDFEHSDRQTASQPGSPGSIVFEDRNVFGTPASSAFRGYTSQTSPDWPSNVARINSEALRQQLDHTLDHFRNLLENIILVASTRHFPHNGVTQFLGIGHFFPGFGHAATFGVRNLDQIGHDTRIGAAGELFVSFILHLLKQT